MPLTWYGATNTIKENEKFQTDYLSSFYTIKINLYSTTVFRITSYFKNFHSRHLHIYTVAKIQLLQKGQRVYNT